MRRKCFLKHLATGYAKEHHSANTVPPFMLALEMFDHKVYAKQPFKQGNTCKDSVLSTRWECPAICAKGRQR